MKIIMDRGLCNTNLEFCQRCSAALIRHPEGYDRPCILEVVDDGKALLTIVMHTDGRTLEIKLSDEDRELASVEGWEVLADFDPTLFRTGAMERWRKISRLPAIHE
ncbi:MAG: hypothetical protein GY805_17555 [Chloroflexi bacterium]|nr:hypothetical protein [Chloroflexota bacterium]